MPEIAVTDRTGSIPQVPTFWTPGTTEPRIIPSGRVASRPRTSTHAKVSQPDSAFAHQPVEEQEARAGG